MRSWLRYAGGLEPSQVHFSSNPSHMSSSFHCRLPPQQKVPSAITEELSATAAGHAAARYAQSPLNLLKDISEWFVISFFSTRCLIMPRWPERVSILVLLIFLLPRTTWRALCATSARPASSTYRRATLRAACSASAWVSPGSAAARLGAETRHVSQGWTNPDSNTMSRAARLSGSAAKFEKVLSHLKGEWFC